MPAEPSVSPEPPASSGVARPPRPVLVTVVLAVVVAAGSLVTAVLLRPDDSRQAREGLSMPPSSVSSGCGDDPCRVVASAAVNGMPVELLADGEGGTGRLRAGGPASGSVAEVTITAMGVRLNHDSLRCPQSDTPVCLVRGPHDGGMAGEVHVWRGDSWRSDQRPYFSDAGSVVLDDATGDDVPEVVVVRHECSGTDSAADCQRAPVLAEVFDLRGRNLGCTQTYGSPGSLRGWPEVDVESYELTECP